jgi:hypothetical protein
MDDRSVFIGSADGSPVGIALSRANRHGLIAGATGTGKTVTVQVLAEGFSNAGVPVFVSDVKGDFSGIAMPGSDTFVHAESLKRRATEVGLADYRYADSPTIFWDLYGKQGHSIRTTVSEMGPLLLAQLLKLNDTQAGVLEIAFRYADDQGLLLLDFPDLRAMLAHTAEKAGELSSKYGNVTKASVGTIQRALLQLEGQGGEQFFGEPAFDVADFFRTDPSGKGFVNILMADRLMVDPKLYATFLLWLMSELFEALPEVGDPAKPKLVFFFDEAHLLFDDASSALQDKIEQVVRLIRSKGIGIYFITQNPIDIPEAVAGQLGNRILHALRAYTPRDQRAIKAAAETFRINPGLDVETAITELKVGEALVSTLMEDGAPSPVERVMVRPPSSRIGPISTGERAMIVGASPIGTKYDERIDRESAVEVIAQKTIDAAATAEEVDAQGRETVGKRERLTPNIWGKALKRATGAMTGSAATIAAAAVTGRKSRSNPMRNAATSAAGSIATDIAGPFAGRFVRNLIGGLMR